MTGVNQLFFCGCLDSDPYMSLKHCDRIICAELINRGVKTERLDRHVPQTQALRKLSRKVLYPAVVRRETSRQSDAILHIGSQCYANLIPFSKSPVTATCHDLAEHYFPQDLSAVQMHRWKQRIARLKKADLIFSVSQHTKNDLINLLNISAEKIIVNYNGIDPVFQRSSGKPVKYCQDIVQLKPDHFLVLTPGADIYRKNLDTLLKATAVLRQRGVPVVIIKTGDAFAIRHSRLIKDMGLSHYIIERGYVCAQELNELYNLCDVLSFPSLYEGFGLPVVEAQRCGLPCVTSNAASLPEVGGDAALYHDPLDAEELSRQLQRVYEDAVLRNDLRKKGFKNSERFSWEKHVDTLLQGFRNISTTC